jgi:hypothetical protein
VICGIWSPSGAGEGQNSYRYCPLTLGKNAAEEITSGRTIRPERAAQSRFGAERDCGLLLSFPTTNFSPSAGQVQERVGIAGVLLQHFNSPNRRQNQ